MDGHLIECPCGVVLRDVEEVQVIVKAQDHALDVHNLTLSDAEARAMVRPSMNKTVE